MPSGAPRKPPHRNSQYHEDCNRRMVPFEEAATPSFQIEPRQSISNSHPIDASSHSSSIPLKAKKNLYALPAIIASEGST